MSRPSNDSSSRSSLPRNGGLAGLERRHSNRQLRSIRKELLIMQADIERIELAGGVADLRDSFTGFKWVSWLLPRRFAGRGSTFASVLSRYPLVSALASIAVAGAPRIGLLRHIKPLIKWGGTGLAIWEAWRAWRRAGADGDDPAAPPGQAGTQRR